MLLIFVVFFISIAVTIVVTASTAVVLSLNVPRTIEDSQWMSVCGLSSIVVVMGRLDASWWKSTIWFFVYIICIIYQRNANYVVYWNIHIN